MPPAMPASDDRRWPIGPRRRRVTPSRAKSVRKVLGFWPVWRSWAALLLLNDPFGSPRPKRLAHEPHSGHQLTRLLLRGS